MSHIISVTNQKGGVGKTTSSVNLAAALAQLGYIVLLVDLDPQGHSGQYLGVKVLPDPVNGQITILEALENKRTLEGCIYNTYLPNLFVIPSNLRLGQFNQNPPLGRQFNLRQALSKSPEVKNFDFVIIDCQPSLSLLTLNALTASDSVLLPVQAEFLAMDGLTQLILTFKEIQAKLHPKLKVLGILLTMYDKRNRLSFEVRSELDKNFGQDLFDTFIPRSVKLAESPSFGKTIFEYDKNSPAAQAYKSLAEEVLARVKAG